MKDPRTGTIATGTSTDSVLIAATQKGRHIPYAGPITEIGKKIGLGVYECTVEAIQIYKKAKGWEYIMGPHIIAIAIGLNTRPNNWRSTNWPHPVRFIGTLISKLTRLVE